ncbi:MAG: carbohydrate binding family 9 domain-containing protein [Candidatus Aminicenantes bacterium]|nr:carbohydrate binding family 9 domain-containing protein [Candidatus Aminicenantes bacterium]
MKLINVKKITFLILLFLPLFISASLPDPKETKTIRAIRTTEPIKIDGILNEKTWQQEGYSDFIMSDPHDGEQPTERTEVRVAYDDKALYVAARLFDSQAESITRRLGRRDDFVDSDWFIFAVDPYYDRRSGFQFAVNPSGSIVDWTLYNDVDRDNTWDGVWDWKSVIDSEGWTVEIKIPYNQLRFPKKKEYIWGVNFRRIIKRKNEEVGFVWIPKEDSGYVSRFARLVGLANIRPGRHIEFLPYVVGSAEFSPEEAGNPFRTGEEFTGNAGFDLKVGLKSNLILDATLNPDFGQVEVDPAVINLSAYETFYSEKRPFFIEGANIFDEFGRGGVTMNANISWPQPTLFYSRRIGRAPQGYVTRDGYINFPDRSTILGAFKLTGKVGKGWNFGFINALTSREYAKIDSVGGRFQEEVEPLSYYGVLRSQKEFKEGQYGFGFLATSVIRDLRNDNLAEILNDKSFSFALDGWTFLDKKRVWVLGGWFGSTQVKGSEAAILARQHSSLHYYQRPDATHVEVDDRATSLSGYGGRFAIGKQKGRFLVHAALGILSPGFDPTDIGFQHGASDIINSHLILAYRWPHPGKIFRNVMLFAGPFRNYDFGGNKIWDGVLVNVEGQFLNYWGFNSMVAYNPRTVSNELTRGGPLALVEPGYQVDLNLNSDNRKQVVLSGYGSLYKRPTWGDYSWSSGISLRWKPKSNISFSFGPGYSVRNTSRQWVSRVEDPLMTDTFGVRYVFGKIYQRVLSSNIRLNWTFTPRLSLQLFLQPFLAVGQYSEFKELAHPKSLDYNYYGMGDSTITFADDNYIIDPDGPGGAPEFSLHNPDFNYKSFRGTVVFRWEYRPGSVFYLVWTQNRIDFSNPGDFRFQRDLGDLFAAPGDNIFMIKFTYRFKI